MRKILGIIAVACMSVSLAACGNSTETSVQESTEISASSELAESVDVNAADDFSDEFSEDETVNETKADDTGSEIIETDAKVSEYDYEGTWVCDRCKIDIVFKGEEYEVLAIWGDSAEESHQWSYYCSYDPAKRTLGCDATGSQIKVISGDDGSIDISTVETEISATFYIKDGKLVWVRNDGDSAEPMYFEKMDQ